MSRFYCNMQGSRGEATRQGTADSGIRAHPRGWHLGISVVGYPSYEDEGLDEFVVRITGGSSGYYAEELAFKVRQSPDSSRFEITAVGNSLIDAVVDILDEEEEL